MISNEILKGSLRTIVLKIITEDGPLHGYAITKIVEEVTEGKIKLTFGALYPVLHKLKKEGALVTATELRNNRTRIYYALTPKGHKLTDRKLKELTDFIDSLQNIINMKPGLSHV
jgi:PadR family transcriptional regulator, regulatory protein PadR